MTGAEEILTKTLKTGGYKMVDGKIVSKRYVSNDGEIIFMRHMTIHATDGQFQKLKNLMDSEGIKYE